MRTPFIAGNWKMNTTVDEATALVRNMLPELNNINGAQKVVCPPFVSLAAVRQLIAGTAVELGAQNMHFEEKGAFTGEVSPLMLAGLCRYVILGHSERRQYFGETNETVNKKIAAALKVGLTPIVCVGEKLDENEAGRTNEVIGNQVKKGLAGIAASPTIVVAYEPVWAIGTGKAATSAQANSTIKFIRDTISDMWGKDTASQIRILYGGSVTASNTAELMGQAEIDGALVGGASLKAADFVSIVQQAARAKGGA